MIRPQPDHGQQHGRHRDPGKPFAALDPRIEPLPDNGVVRRERDPGRDHPDPERPGRPRRHRLRRLEPRRSASRQRLRTDSRPGSPRCSRVRERLGNRPRAGGGTNRPRLRSQRSRRADAGARSGRLGRAQRGPSSAFHELLLAVRQQHAEAARGVEHVGLCRRCATERWARILLRRSPAGARTGAVERSRARLADREPRRRPSWTTSVRTWPSRSGGLPSLSPLQSHRHREARQIRGPASGGSRSRRPSRPAYARVCAAALLQLVDALAPVQHSEHAPHSRGAVIARRWNANSATMAQRERELDRASEYHAEPGGHAHAAGALEAAAPREFTDDRCQRIGPNTNARGGPGRAPPPHRARRRSCAAMRADALGAERARDEVDAEVGQQR